MVVVLAPAVGNIYELFTHNQLTLAKRKPNFLSLIGFHKEWIFNARKFKFKFGGGQHGYACIDMGQKQYSLH